TAAGPSPPTGTSCSRCSSAGAGTEAGGRSGWGAGDNGRASATSVGGGGGPGSACVTERWWRGRPSFVERPWTRGRRAWHRFVTFQVVCFAWIFFRADSFADAWDLVQRLFTAWGEPSPLVTWGIAAAIAVGIGSQSLPRRLPLQIMARFSR